MSQQSEYQLFDGSLWINLAVTLAHLEREMKKILDPMDLTVIEWYVMRAISDRDKVHISDIARIVGRPATSFTPIMDGLVGKKLIERVADPRDRRAFYVVFTAKAKEKPFLDQMVQSIELIDRQINQLVGDNDTEGFYRVLGVLQTLTLKIYN